MRLRHPPPQEVNPFGIPAEADEVNLVGGPFDLLPDTVGDFMCYLLVEFINNIAHTMETCNGISQ